MNIRILTRWGTGGTVPVLTVLALTVLALVGCSSPYDPTTGDPAPSTSQPSTSGDGCEAAIAVSTATGAVGIAAATNPSAIGAAITTAISTEKKLRDQLSEDIRPAYDTIANDLQAMGDEFDTDAQNLWAADTAPLDHWVTAHCQAYRK